MGGEGGGDLFGMGMGIVGLCVRQGAFIISVKGVTVTMSLSGV